MDLSVIGEVRKYLQIVHHIPGRLRLRFDAELVNHPQVASILDRGKTLPIFRNVRLNPAARSLVIEYDRERIRPELFQELFSTGSGTRVEEIVKVLSAA